MKMRCLGRKSCLCTLPYNLYLCYFQRFDSWNILLTRTVFEIHAHQVMSCVASHAKPKRKYHASAYFATTLWALPYFLLLLSVNFQQWQKRRPQFTSLTWGSLWGSAVMAALSRTSNGPCSMSGTRSRLRYVRLETSITITDCCFRWLQAEKQLQLPLLRCVQMVRTLTAESGPR